MAANTPPPTRVRFDDAKKASALELVALEGYNRGALADAFGISLRTLDRHVADDHVFADAIERAKLAFLSSLVAAARTRAIDGVDEVTSGPGGTKVTRKRYSDALLALLLKSRLGLGQFTDRVEVDQTVQGHIEHSGAIHPDDLTTEQQRAARVLLRRSEASQN